jgi:membrane protein implicated in regulation of membrane protease activity
MALLEEIVFWHWGIIAMAFLILEMLSGGYFFLFIGAAGGFVSLLMLVAPSISWQMQLVIWGVLSVVLIWGWRLYRKNNPPEESAEPTLNQRGQQYVDREFTLDQPIVNGLGKIKVDDSTWKVEAEEDMETGTKVKVTGAESTILKVEAVK